VYNIFRITHIQLPPLFIFNCYIISKHNTLYGMTSIEV